MKLKDDDVKLLRALVISLEGELLAGGVDAQLAERLVKTLRSDGMLNQHEGVPELRLALANLGHRILAALHPEYASSAADNGRTIHSFKFPGPDAASRFISDIADPTRSIIAVTNDDLGLRVRITLTPLPLSREFDRSLDQLRRSAEQLSGVYEGWESAS